MLIIDCNNLWYAAMTLGEPLSGIARSELVRLLEAYSGRATEPMTIVLDGHAPSRGARQADERSPSRRIYAGRRPADDVIGELVTESSEPRRLTVVSDDRSLLREIRKRKAKAVGSAVFARRLLGWLRCTRRQQPGEPVGKQAGLGGSAASIGKWLKFFELTREKSDIIGSERAGTRQTGQAERNTSPSSPSPDVAVESSSDWQMRRVFEGVQPLKRRKPRQARPPRRRTT